MHECPLGVALALELLAPPCLIGEVVVMIRPETVRLALDPDGPGLVADREYFGQNQLVTVALPRSRSCAASWAPAPISLREIRWPSPSAKCRPSPEVEGDAADPA